MKTRIATLVWQLVEAAGSVVGLRYGTREPYYTVQRRTRPTSTAGLRPYSGSP
jgi:hypothetical protein